LELILFPDGLFLFSRPGPTRPGLFIHTYLTPRAIRTKQGHVKVTEALQAIAQGNYM